MTAERYRRRWAAEKVFDEIKNKLGEKKGTLLTSLGLCDRRATQRRVKFVRW